MWLGTGPAKQHAPPLALTCILGTHTHATHLNYHAQTNANPPSPPLLPTPPRTTNRAVGAAGEKAGLGAYTCVSVQDWDARKRLELKQLLVDTGKASTPVGLALGGADDDDDEGGWVRGGGG